jgi:CBS domain-containing protein
MTIARLLEGRTSTTITCDAGHTVEQAIDLLAAHRIGALPVLEGGELVGIFSERDVIYQLHERGPSMLNLAVREVMTARPETVTPETEVLEALSLITERRIRHLPVMQSGRMVGLVSIGDLVKYRIDSIAAEADAMRVYIQTA